MGGAEHAFKSLLRWTIEVEWPAHPTFMPVGEREAFCDYYRNLPKSGDEEAIGRYLRGYWRAEAGWTARWIAARAAERQGPVRVMDAGSGFGTFAMLYAAVGAEVIAADLRPDRLHAADLRIAFHAERTGRRLPVRQLRADLTQPWPDDVDLVWVYNALSHIDPLEGFLEQARRSLRPGGVLVIGDINGALPAHQARLSKVRSKVLQEYVAPDGTRHGYAVEREFPPRELRTVMAANGFRVVHHELYWGGMGVLPELLYAMQQVFQQRWWLGHTHARRQLLVATPAGRAGS